MAVQVSNARDIHQCQQASSGKVPMVDWASGTEFETTMPANLVDTLSTVHVQRALALLDWNQVRRLIFIMLPSLFLCSSSNNAPFAMLL